MIEESGSLTIFSSSKDKRERHVVRDKWYMRSIADKHLEEQKKKLRNRVPKDL